VSKISVDVEYHPHDQATTLIAKTTGTGMGIRIVPGSLADHLR
jgi:hypothetical protein